MEKTNQEKSTNLTGSFNDYYVVQVEYCQRNPDSEGYSVEAQDLIRALNLNFDEGNILKELFRIGNSRKGISKQGHRIKYGREKIKHSADALLEMNLMGLEDDE